MDSEKVEGAQGPSLSPIEQLVTKAWNLMGGEIHWPALPWIAEMMGCDDYDNFVALLVVIRNNRRENDGSSRTDD